jgi:hypothetical protein
MYFNKCKIDYINNGFNILKVNDSTCVHMLIVEKMWKKSPTHSTTNMKI